LNIKLIHNAAYYIDTADPHNDCNDGYVVQHITFEDYAANSSFALKSVINEMMIKEDLKEEKISLFDWKLFNLGFMSFGLIEKIDEVDRCFFMNINADGTFNISEQELDLFNMNDYYKLLRIFEDSKTNGSSVKGLIRDSSGNINLIKETDWFTIPEIDNIYLELLNGNNRLRGKEKRDALMTSSLDIHTFEMAGQKGLFYFVGDIGEGMRPEIHRAANINGIECVDNAPDLFSNLLPLMDVSFVRNGQLTVIPFPFKYLREYIKKNY